MASNTVVKKGKQLGVKNFTPTEDLNITKAYKEVTTDASVGTDQEGDAYYSRIAEVFLRLMGSDLVQDRTPAAIRSRWVNAIQKALLKFTSCMNKAVSEYHSGWTFDDYLTLAKKYYQSQTNKVFAHELSWFEVKALPKFCIATDEMSQQMKKALELDNTDSEGDNPGSLNAEDDAQEARPGSASSKRSLRMTPRPSIGKKAAKKLKYESPSQPSDADERNACLQRLADNSDRKAQLQADRFAMSLFAMDPTSSDAIEFLAIKKEEMLIDARLRLEMKKKKLAELQVNVPASVIEVDDENQDL